MITTTVSAYGGTVPARSGQSQSAFNTNMNAMFVYIASISSDIDDVTAEINSTAADVNTAASNADQDASTATAAASAALGNANVTTYSGSATYSLYDAVIGSDGGTYRCMTNGTTGDNPVGSITGNWLRLTFAEPAVNIKTGNFTAATDITYLVDTSGGAITATLPESPAAGQRLHFGDYAGTWKTYNLILSRNGNNIMGLAEDINLNINAFVAFVYVDSTVGWRLIK